MKSSLASNMAGQSTLDLGLLLRWLAALLSLGAAGIHFAVAPAHFEEYWLFGWFFVAVAWLQALWALAVATDRRRWVLYVGLAGNLLLVLVWAWTRVVSVPIGPGAGKTEALGLTDETTVVFELNAVLTALLLLIVIRMDAARARTSWRLAAGWLLAVALLLIALTGVSLSRDSGDHGAQSPPNHVGHAP